MIEKPDKYQYEASFFAIIIGSTVINIHIIASLTLFLRIFIGFSGRGK